MEALKMADHVEPSSPTGRYPLSPLLGFPVTLKLGTALI